MTYPTIHILPGHDRRLRSGSPWIYSNELRMDAAARALPPGSVARLVVPNGKTFALVHVNPHSLIAARVLTRNKDGRIDHRYLERRLARALALRERLFDRPFYRLVHAEGDGLPGLVIDRYGDVLVVQLNTAGMAALEAELMEALDRLLRPRVVVLRGDSPVRELEGLPLETRIVKGSLDGPISLEENGLPFLADPVEGQKTGWFFDQRENRAFVTRLARDQKVLDLYAHSGGFGLQALAGGAREALLVDRSGPPLELASASARLQGVEDRVSVERAEVFQAIDRLVQSKASFGLVIADPPAFVRSKKDLKPGLRGYRKLARGAAMLVGEAGFFAIACCSHNVEPGDFADAVRQGLRDAGRGARLLRQSTAGPDHPVHPVLPETSYLKFLAYAVD
jgi:23S rRNA (cytosine1962-C5)-methyltransferase